MDFGAYFCKEVLSGIVCSKDEFSCSEFLAPTLTSSSRHRIVPKLSLESHLLTLEVKEVMLRMAIGDCSSKGRIVILGRIVSSSGQIFRSYFRYQDEIFRPGMPFRPLDEQSLTVTSFIRYSQVVLFAGLG